MRSLVLALSLLAALPAYGFGSAQGTPTSFGEFPPAQGSSQAAGLGSAQGENFRPDFLAGLKLWIDPDDSNTTTVSGGSLTAILDKAQGLSFTVPSGANAPAFASHTVDGGTVGAIDFDDANSESLGVGQAVVSSPGFTVVTVQTTDDFAASNTVFSITDSSAYTTNFYRAGYTLITGAPYWQTKATSSQSVGVTGAPPVDEVSVFSAREVAANDRHLRVDGAQGSDGTTSLTPPNLDETALGVLGVATRTQYLSGKILLVLVYDRALSDEELRQVEDYAHRQKVHDPGAGVPAVGLVLDLDPSAEDSFQPTDLSGCVLWLDPTDSTSKTVNGTGDVTAITDKSDSGLTFTVPAAANAPADSTFTTGDGRTIGALLFDSVNTEGLAAGASLTGAPGTAYVVFTSTDDANVQTPLAFSDKDASTDYMEATIWGNVANDLMVWNVYDGGTPGQASIDPGYDTSNPFVFRVTETSAASRAAAKDSQTEATNTTSVTPANVDSTSIGFRYTSSSTNYLAGKILAVVAYDRVLADWERAKVETWLYRKIGTAASTWNYAGKGLTSLDQATFANRPAVDVDGLNGHAALLFDDAASQVLEADVAAVTAAPFTVVSVFNSNDEAVEQTVFGVGDDAVNTDYWGIRLAGTLAGNPIRWRVRDTSFTVSAKFETGYVANETYLASAVESAANARTIYKNGVEGIADTTSVTPAGAVDTRIGRGVGALRLFYMSGEIGRLLLYKRALSDSERKQAEAALAPTWGAQ